MLTDGNLGHSPTSEVWASYDLTGGVQLPLAHRRNLSPPSIRDSLKQPLSQEPPNVLIFGVALRLWFPLSDAAWLGGMPVAAPRGVVSGISSVLPDNSAGSAGASSSGAQQGEPFWQQLAAATPENIRQMLEEAWQIKRSQGHRGFMGPDRDSKRVEALWQRCFELAPAEALEWFRRLTATERTFCQETFFKTWETLDPKAARVAMSQYEDGLLSVSQPEALTALLESDPAAALTLALELPVGPLRAKAAERALLALLKQNPAQAFGRLIQLDGQQNVGALAKNLIQTLAKSDLYAAKESLSLFPAGRLREQMVQHLAEEVLSRGTPQEALAWMRQLPSEKDQAAALSDVGGAGAYQKLAGFFEEAARTDLTLAVSLFDHLKSIPDDIQAKIRLTDAARGLYREWHKSDPAAALAWATKQPSGVFSPFAGQVLKMMQKQGAGALLELGLPAGSTAWLAEEWDDRKRILTHLRQENKMDTVRTFGSGGGQMYGILLLGESKEMDAKGMDAILTGLPQDAFRSGLARRFAMQMMSIDAASAMDFASVAAVDLGEADWKELTKSLASNAPQAASQWLQGMAPGEKRDTAVGQLVPVILADGDPAAAFQWSTTVTDENQRLRLMTPALAAWHLADPAAAAEALESSNLSGVARAGLQQLFIKP